MENYHIDRPWRSKAPPLKEVEQQPEPQEPDPGTTPGPRLPRQKDDPSWVRGRDEDGNVFIDDSGVATPLNVAEEISDWRRVFGASVTHVLLVVLRLIPTFTPKGREIRKVSNAFDVIVSKLAEDLSSVRTEGEAYFDMYELLARRINRRLIYDCMYDLERERLVLVLDTSLSCKKYAGFFAAVAAAGARRGDIEIYAAPNADIRYTYDPGRRRWFQSKKTWSDFKRRKVIFFGDHDGIDALVEASSAMDLYWFNGQVPGTFSSYNVPYRECESRIKNEFKGSHFPCYTEDDLVRYAKKIR